MKLISRWVPAGLSFVLVLSMLVGCAPADRQSIVHPPAAAVNTPQAVAIPATAENLGAIDALILLKMWASRLTGDAFSSSKSWSEQRQNMLDGIDAAMDEAVNGTYDRASAVLTAKVQDPADKYMAGDNQTRIKQLIAIAGQCIDNAAKTTLDITTGKIAGAAGYVKSYVWKGIPYARPPIGDLRWRAPLDPDPWNGIRHSTDSYDISAQKEQTRLWVPTGRVVGSEDCLYLNVWRPSSDARGLPVYFWIHGGGNNFGTGKLYDGSILSNQSNMVVVTIQYRLGPMGWFNHPALNSGVTAEEASGNFGTLDILKALQWVKNNISAFGGNPENVTVAGESAGGHNTINLVMSPLAKGLFHRAICESPGMKPIPVEEGIAQANSTIEKLLIADGKVKTSEDAIKYRENMALSEIASYLKSKNAADLINIKTAERMKTGFHPAFIDGKVIPGSWLSTIDSGRYNRVPIILGSNEYELKPFEPLLGAAIPTSNGHRWADLYKVLNGQLKLDDVLASQFDRDLYEACGLYGTRYWKAKYVDSIARKLKEKQDNVWCYLFKWGGKGSGPSPYDFIIGAGHATEIPFFFGWPRDTFGYAFTDQNEQGRMALQQAVMSYAAQFAATGEPNTAGNGLTYWDTWSNEAGGPKCIVFDGTFNEAKVSMMTEEITAEKVLAEVETLPLLIKPVVKMWLQ